MSFRKIIEKNLKTFSEKFTEDTIVFVPGDCFFVTFLDIPSELKGNDLEDFIELGLEANSPFPVEQLFWGYVIDFQTHKAVVYASPKSRIRALLPGEESDPHFLFPSFLPIISPEEKEPIQRIIAENTLTLLEFDSQSRLPCKIISRRLKTDPADSTALNALSQEMAKANGLDPQAVSSSPIWINEGLKDDPQSLNFPFTRFQSGNSSPENLSLNLPSAQLWSADIRDRDFATKEAKSRRQGKILWKSLLTAFYALGVLVLIQLFVFISHFILGLQDKEIAELDPIVNRITNKIQLAERLTQSTERDVQPFVMLESINSLRPNSIFYRKVASRQFNELEIEGESNQGISPVNEFADAILKLEFVQSVENNPQTRNNKTQFDYVIQFASLPEITIALPEEPTEDESTEETEEEAS